MPVEFSRAERIGVAIQRHLSELVPRLKDPRLGMVTIHEARVTRDLSFAKVYFTVLDGNAEENLKILQQAAGHLRHELGKHSKLRTIPELRFVIDTSIEYGNKLQSLIEQAVADDAHDDANKDNE
ncbi:MAG: 30S ribosome-binding factor RbfA [Pseudomonadota bacterium]